MFLHFLYILYGGMLTGTALLGNLASRLNTDKKLEYDPKTLKFTNDEKANSLLSRKARDGWYV